MTTEAVMDTGGLVEAFARIMRQVIRTPRLRDALVLMLNSIDPEGARELVRVLFWEDTGLFLAIVGAVPSLVNGCCEAASEMAAQFNAMPTPLLQEFVGRIADGIDGASAGEAAGGLVNLLLSLGAAGSTLPESLASLGSEFGRSYCGAARESTLTGRLEGWVEALAARAADENSGTHALIREAGRALERHPEFAENVLKPLLSPVVKSIFDEPGRESRG